MNVPRRRPGSGGAPPRPSGSGKGPCELGQAPIATDRRPAPDLPRRPAAPAPTAAASRFSRRPLRLPCLNQCGPTMHRAGRLGRSCPPFPPPLATALGTRVRDPLCRGAPFPFLPSRAILPPPTGVRPKGGLAASLGAEPRRVEAGSLRAEQQGRTGVIGAVGAGVAPQSQVLSRGLRVAARPCRAGRPAPAQQRGQRPRSGSWALPRSLGPPQLALSRPSPAAPASAPPPQTFRTIWGGGEPHVRALGLTEL